MTKALDETALGASDFVVGERVIVGLVLDREGERLLAGRDLVARVLYGGRYTIAGSVVSVLIATVVGTWLGLLAGYFGGFLDMVIMRLIDLLLAFPGLLLALALATIFGPGLNAIAV